MMFSFIKRIFDIIFSITLIFILFPLLLLVYIIIFLEIRQNPIFTQYRNGKDLKKFKIFKFKTMYKPEDGINVFVQATKNDSRVTKIGKFLRSSSIDEIPQIFNIFIGNMSFVGPRPHPIALDEEFITQISSYKKRYQMKPGITGLAQVNGFRGETDTLEKMENRVFKDIEYVNNHSIIGDFIILLKTLKVLFKGV